MSLPDTTQCYCPSTHHDLLGISVGGLFPSPSSTLHRSRASSDWAGQIGLLRHGIWPNHCGPKIFHRGVFSSLHAIANSLGPSFVASPLLQLHSGVGLKERLQGWLPWEDTSAWKSKARLGEPRAPGLPPGGRAGGQNTNPVPALLTSPPKF